MVAPTQHLRFAFLERVFPSNSTAHVGRQLITKVAFDQVTIAPVMLLIYMPLMGTIYGQSPAEIKQRLQEKYWTVLQTNWCFGPAVVAVNLLFVALPYRVLFMNVCQVLWASFLSSVQHQCKE